MAKIDTRERFPELLAEYRGIVTDACKAAGIARKTYYEWREKYPDFAKECDDVSEQVIDFVETNLYKNIAAGKEASTIFYLKTKAKHRGYVESVEHSGPGGQPLIPQLTSNEAARRLAFAAFLIDGTEQPKIGTTDSPSDVLEAEDVEIIEEE